MLYAKERRIMSVHKSHTQYGYPNSFLNSVATGNKNAIMYCEGKYGPDRHNIAYWYIALKVHC